MKPDGTSAGYGFVHFEQEESATAAVEKVNGMLLKSQQVYVGAFERRTKRLDLHKAKFTNVYVKHLAADVNKEKLDEIFCMSLNLLHCLTSHTLNVDFSVRYLLQKLFVFLEMLYAC